MQFDVWYRSKTEEQPVSLWFNADAVTIDYLAENLFKNRRKIPAILAERSIAQAFSAQWSKLTGMSYETGMEQRIHALYSVNKTFTPPGNICKATENDLDTVLQWSRKFYFDCYGEII